jgi:GNAT superfamily N-acetyltransferase
MLQLRPATRDDVPEILSLIRELAEYERDPDAAVVTENDLLRDGFGEQPRFHVVMALWDDAVAGMAFYFINYSTWDGRVGVYLEDIFVRPQHRGDGIGRALMKHLAQATLSAGGTRLVLQVLDWNEPAIGFYEKMGAKVMGEWLTMRVRDDALKALADEG